MSVEVNLNGWNSVDQWFSTGLALGSTLFANHEFLLVCVYFGKRGGGCWQ